MKSGGNAPHGTGYYFRHDDWTDKPNFFDVRAAQKLGKDARSDADQEPAVRRHVRRPDQGRTRRSSSATTKASASRCRRPTTSTSRPTAQIATARSRIAAAGLQVNPIGENLIKFYPTDPTGTLHVAAPTVANMSTFSVKVDQQSQREQPDQRARLLRTQLSVGARRQQR